MVVVNPVTVESLRWSPALTVEPEAGILESPWIVALCDTLQHSTGMRLQTAFASFLQSIVADFRHSSQSFALGVGPHGASIIRQFREAGAVSSRSARRYYPRSQADAAAFARLLERFIIRQTTPGHYFLNEPALLM